VAEQRKRLIKSRRTKKMTKAEAETLDTIDKALEASLQAVEKEITDVTSLTKND
jgi:hypothetical protein